MKLCSIASGSSGNCIFVGSSETCLLVDVGISGKRIEEGLRSLEVDPLSLDGIFITHEHSDHISGLGVMARRYHLPIFATIETIQAILKISSLGKIDETLFCPITPNQDFVVKDVTIHPFSIYHDAANPVAYRFESEGQAIGILTDSGKYDQYIVDNLQELDILLLEANHDIHMLQAGSYPYPLKKRILGDHGHLSNELSGQLLDSILNKHLKYVILGHLSKENNYAELAYETVRLEVDMSDSPFHSNDFAMTVAKRDCISASVQI